MKFNTTELDTMKFDTTEFDTTEFDLDILSPYANAVPEMEYTYKGGCYPKKILLHHPEIERILRKITLDLTYQDIDYILTLPADTLREDLQQLILREIGRQFGKNIRRLQRGNCDGDLIGNCFLFLSKVGVIQDTLPVLVEFLRQSFDILDFNEGDAGCYYIKSLVYNFLQVDPTCFKSFLLEEGLASIAKIELLDFIHEIVCGVPSLRQPILTMIRDILEQYKKDLPYRTICDGTVVAFAIGIPAELGATELLPLVEELFATDMVDKTWYGDIDDVREMFNEPTSADNFALPYGNIYAIVDEFKKCFGGK